MNKNPIKTGGFTLVELAVVLAIIGVLIGGLLKGSHYIRLSQLNRTWIDMQNYETAAKLFQEKYDQMPGNMPTAQKRLVGCIAPASGGFCYNGNGDESIGEPTTPVFDPNGFWYTDQTGTAQPKVETSMFWLHLSLAGYITSITGGDPADPTWGKTQPIAPWGNGGFAVESYGSNQVAIVLKNEITGVFTATDFFTGERDTMAINGIWSEIMDRKFDDGIAHSGRLITWGLVPVCNYGDVPGGLAPAQPGFVHHNFCTPKYLFPF